MTPDDLRAWQSRMGLTTYTAPEALGVVRRTYMAWLSGTNAISRVVALACAALEAGIDVPDVTDDASSRVSKKLDVVHKMHHN